MLLFVVPLLVTLYTQVFIVGSTFHYDDRRLAFHESVLANDAPMPAQYRCYLQDLILESVFRWLPHKAGWFNLLYTLYYGMGAVVFIILLFRLCNRVASVSAAALACAYLAAVYSIFLWDNWYHPYDTWGCSLAVLIMEALLDRNSKRYLLLLLISGFVWEKHYLVPLAVGCYELWRSRKLLRTAALTAISMVAAVAGQSFPWLMLHASAFGFPKDRINEQPLLGQDLHQIPLAAAGLLVLYGIQIWFSSRKSSDVPDLFKFMLLQLPVWLLLEIVTRANLREMRSSMVMVALTWPVLAQYIDRVLILPASGPRERARQ